MFGRDGRQQIRVGHAALSRLISVLPVAPQLQRQWTSIPPGRGTRERMCSANSSTRLRCPGQYAVNMQHSVALYEPLEKWQNRHCAKGSCQ